MAIYEVGFGKAYSIAKDALAQLYIDAANLPFTETHIIRMFDGVYTDFHGTYHQCLNVDGNTGLAKYLVPTATYNLIIEAAPNNNNVIMDGSATPHPTVGIQMNELSYFIIRGITCRYCSADGIVIDNCSHATVYGNNVSYVTEPGGGYGIWVKNGSSYITVDRNIVHSTSFSGIWIFLSSHCIVKNNITYDNPAYAGIWLHTSTDTDIYNNLSYGNAYGIDFEGGSNNCNIYNNVLYLNNSYQISIYLSSSAKIKNNILWAIAGACIVVNDATSKTGFVSDYNDFYITGTAIIGAWSGSPACTTLALWRSTTSQDTNAIDVNPILENPGGSNINNYKLKYASPCIDKGVDLGSSFNRDYFGTKRPEGTAWDIGLYEYPQTNYSIPAVDATMPILLSLYTNITRRFKKTYLSIAYAFYYSLARALTSIGVIDFKEAMKQFNINTATGEFLDIWGSWFGVKRYTSETDSTFARRTISRVIDPRNIKKVIEEAVRRVDGVYFVSIKEGTYGVGYIGYSYIGFIGEGDFVVKSFLISDSQFYNPFFFTVLIKARTGTDMQRILDAIDDTKAGGIRYVVQILNDDF